MICRGQSNSWPGTKNTEFWSSTATFIASTVTIQSTVPRTGTYIIYWIGNVVYFVIIIGNACRNTVLKTLRKRFKSPKEAEEYYYPQ